MNLLAELHQEHDLKLNLKFEIEVLCKMLGLDIASLTPGTLLKEHDKLNKMLNFFGQKQPPVQPPPHQPPTSLPPPPVHTTAKSAMDAFSAHLPRYSLFCHIRFASVLMNVNFQVHAPDQQRQR